MQSSLLLRTSLIAGLFSLHAHANMILIDFGNTNTFRGVTANSPDLNGNHWNSVGFGFFGNMVDSTGAASTIDWAPAGLGGVDSFNSLVGSTSTPPSAGELAAAQTLLNGGSVGEFGVAEAAIDYYVSNNGTSGVGRFQLQQVTPGQQYEMRFYGSHQFAAETQTTYSVFDDSGYSNLLGSVTITHGNGTGVGNINNVGVISGLVGPANANNIFYVQWQGATTAAQGYLNAMSITAIPEASTASLILLAGIGMRLLRRKRT